MGLISVMYPFFSSGSGLRLDISATSDLGFVDDYWSRATMMNVERIERRNESGQEGRQETNTSAKFANCKQFMIPPIHHGASDLHFGLWIFGTSEHGYPTAAGYSVYSHSLDIQCTVKAGMMICIAMR